MKPKAFFAMPVIAICLHIMCPAAYAAEDADRTRFFEEREIIARAVECTAPDASYVARLGIAALIVNRTRDARFADDVRSVIYEYDAFECTLMHGFETCEVSELSRMAARDALLGFDCTCGALYFRRGTPSESADACFYHSGLLFYKQQPKG